MTTRSESMAPLIARLRVLVGDPAGEREVFSDEELQEFLDERRSDIALAPLRADTVLSGSPTVFRTSIGWWESDAILVDAAGSPLTPAVAGTDPLRGVWAFATAPSGTVYVSGRNYDLYGSAAAVLQARAAKVVAEFDFGAETGVFFRRSQKGAGMLAIARELARKAISPGMRS